MHADPVIEAVCKRLAREYAAHTILLYGSRANGTETQDSDYDIAAFGPVHEVQRVTDSVGHAYLDVFVYPESMLLEASDELLRFQGSAVLLQRDQQASQFLAGLERRFALGPATLNPTEVKARRDWLWKMTARMCRGDVEGDFRRVWLLTALLEDYFVLRQSWYRGPKMALRWLEANDSVGLNLFVTALAPGAPMEAIQSLVRHVTGDA